VHVVEEQSGETVGDDGLLFYWRSYWWAGGSGAISFIGFFYGELGDFFGRAIIEDLEVFFLQVANGVAGGVADYDGDDYDVYIDLESCARCWRDLRVCVGCWGLRG